MKYAIVVTGGKQYKVEEDQEILIDRIEGKEGDKVTFDEVLLLVDGETRQIGQPTLGKTSVAGKITRQTKGKKIRVAVYKAKSRYRKVRGHRQQLTLVKIEAFADKTRKRSTKA